MIRVYVAIVRKFVNQDLIWILGNIFSQIALLADGTVLTRTLLIHPAWTVSKIDWIKLGAQGWLSSWTSPLNPSAVAVRAWILLSYNLLVWWLSENNAKVKTHPSQYHSSQSHWFVTVKGQLPAWECSFWRAVEWQSWTACVRTVRVRTVWLPEVRPTHRSDHACVDARVRLSSTEPRANTVVYTLFHR